MKSRSLSVWLLFACAAPASAQMHLEYSGLLSPQLAGVHSKFTLAPLSPIPFPDWDNPGFVGRSYGRVDVVPVYDTGASRSGVHFGLYSNVNTAYFHRRGVVEFDRTNLNLTRIRPEAPLAFDRLHLFHEGGFGRLELGWAPGVSHRMAVTAPLNWGAGSVGGDYPYFMDKPLDVGFVSVSAYGSANTAPRLVYFSPKLHGFEFGASYQPDTRYHGGDFFFGRVGSFGLLGRRSNADADLWHSGVRTPFVNPHGITNGSFEAHTAGFRHVFEAGLRSQHQWGAFRIATSVAGLVGQAVKSPTGTPFNDLRSVQAGVQVGWGGWTIGAGYVGAFDSGYGKWAHWRQRKNQWAVHGGIQYETGPWTFGIATLIGDDAGDPSERSDRQLHVYSAGLRYRISPEMDVGAEVNYIRPLSADYGDYNAIVGILQLRYRFGGSTRPGAFLPQTYGPTALGPQQPY